MKNVHPRLKKGVVPRLFACQKSPTSVTVARPGAVKRRRRLIVEEAISEHEKRPFEEATSSSVSEHVHSDALEEAETAETLYKHKGIQVNIKPPCRSRGTNTKVLVTTQAAVSPIKIRTTETGVSPIKINLRQRMCGPFEEERAEVDETDTGTDSEYNDLSTTSTESYEKQFQEELAEQNLKGTMREYSLLAMEKNPKIFLGLPLESFYLIQILSARSHSTTLNILITLKKIKLNDPYTILGIHFGMSVANISRIFTRTIPIIADLMQELIVWPPTERLKYHMPIPFRARYSKVVSIIDCLEIQIEKPSNPLHQALTWSQYKNCNTIKYLISCTPDGLVNYISGGYGGRSTDFNITEDCGFLDRLSPGMQIMADRGFKNLASLLQQKGCELIRPPSVSSKVQSTKQEVKESKRIAALRIHVERVIGRLREFGMLEPHACLDNHLVPYSDYIIIIACGIINLQDHIIKQQI